MVKKGFDKERELRNIFIEHGFLVIRATGSMGFADLVVYNPDTKDTMLFEVKSTHNSYFRPFKREKEQFQSILGIHKKYKVPFYYAVRFIVKDSKRKESKWYIYNVDDMNYPFRLLKSKNDVKSYDKKKDVIGVPLLEFINSIKSDRIEDYIDKSEDIVDRLVRLQLNLSRLGVLVLNTDSIDTYSSEIDELNNRLMKYHHGLSILSELEELYGLLSLLVNRYYDVETKDIMKVCMEYIEYLYREFTGVNIKSIMEHLQKIYKNKV